MKTNLLLICVGMIIGYLPHFAVTGNLVVLYLGFCVLAILNFTYAYWKEDNRWIVKFTAAICLIFTASMFLQTHPSIQTFWQTFLGCFFLAGGSAFGRLVCWLNEKVLGC